VCLHRTLGAGIRGIPPGATEFRQVLTTKQPTTDVMAVELVSGTHSSVSSSPFSSLQIIPSVPFAAVDIGLVSCRASPSYCTYKFHSVVLG
jgi:hypothetical protein